MISNRINKKFYIGMTTNFERRMIEHVTPKNLRKNTSLARAFRKYGVSSFTCCVLQFMPVEILPKMEQWWIHTLAPQYNRTKGGDGTVGHTVRPDIRRRLSEAGKRQWAAYTPEQRQAISKRLIGPGVGHKVSSETRHKLRLANLGKRHSAATKLKMSATHKRLKSKLNEH